MIWRLIKFFLFKIDAESAHRIMTRLLRVGIQMGNVPLVIASGNSAKKSAFSHKVWGLDFHSPLGLAAGFDKDAEILAGLPALGFGFSEIGTVTPKPQPGNERPRLFRDVAHGAIFNRMGFNGLGASIVSERLRVIKPHLPENFRVGVNVGKNKDTPLEGAAHDYAKAASMFEELADYVVINVSSPNTPGLRSLQNVDSLSKIVREVQSVLSRWRKTPPLLLKIAPELTGSALSELLEAGESWKIQGWILTNTLAGEYKRDGATALMGGWSGSSLQSISRERLVEANRVTSLPIVSVGGIVSEQEALDRLKCGASLIQIYSGWIFQGPTFPSRIIKHIKNSGFKA